MTLANKLKKAGVKPKPKRNSPVWAGPESEADNGGVTFSLLTRYLTCRERFRLHVVEGLRTMDRFNHRLEYGNMWHVCEEALASGWSGDGNLQVLTEYCQDLCKRYPMDQDQIDKWYNVCKVQFPIYVKWWSEHPDVIDRTPLLQEQVFKVPYKLPSGRVVYLRGKWDSVDMVGKGKQAGIWLMENKTKGDIDEIQLQRQLKFDLQTMMYLVSFERWWEDEKKRTRAPDNWLRKEPIRGVRYNVVRRPLSGGKGTIVQHKPSKKNPQGESKADYYQRLAGIIDGSAKDAPGPRYYFMRWNVEVTPGDVARFRRQCLDPILEGLCEWWSYMMTCHELGGGNPWYGSGSIIGRALHYQHPFGSINWLYEGNHSDLDEYMRSGNEVGLTRSSNLFPELVS